MQRFLSCGCRLVPLLVLLSVSAPHARAAVGAGAPILGNEHVYRVTMTGTSHVDFGLMSSGVSRAVGESRPDAPETSQIQTVRYDVSATLHTRLLASAADGAIVAARLQDVRYAVDGTVDGRQELLSTPFTIRYDRTGRIVSFQFPDRFPDELGKAIQRLVEPLQAVSPDNDATTWTVEERDADVDYTARYEAGAPDPATGLVTWTKVKTAVRPRELVASRLPLAGIPSGRVNRSSALFTFDPILGTVVSVRATESVTSYWGRAFFSDYDHEYEAVRVQATLGKLARTVAEADALRHDAAFARARLYDVDAHTRRTVEVLRLPQMMSSYRAIAPTKTALASHQLGSWLRLNPRASIEVARQIDALDPKAERDAFEFGWAALAKAGHPEAQQALLEVATQPGFRPLSQTKAIIAMMSVEAPEPPVAAALWTLRSSVAAEGVPSRRMSILTNVYGSLGDIEKGNPALTDQVVANLAGLLARPDVRSRVFALDALSNVGDFDRVAPLAVRHLTATDPRERMAAFSTFRRMTGDAAFEAFATAFAGETQPEVREAAARVAYQMPKTTARNVWATAQAVRESDPRVLSELVQILGRGMSLFPENARTLQGLLETTRVRAVRRDIYTYVTPVAQGGAR